MKVFGFQEYRQFILHKIEEAGKPKGYRKRLAEAAGCTSAFLSQVLGSHVHLTLEQAVGIASFWQLQVGETEYFLDLVQIARAGTPRLREIIANRMEKLKIIHDSIEKRVAAKGKIAAESAPQYYSSWIPSAVHIGLTIPSLRTIPALAKRLRLSHETVQRTLSELEHLGLVLQKGDGIWMAQQADLHLAASSPMARIQHTNWRQRAMAVLAESSPTDVFSYSAVHALAKADVEKIKDILLEAIEKSRGIVAPSPEEELICVLMDLVPV